MASPYQSEKMSDIQGMKPIGSAHCTQYKTEARFYIATPPDGQRKLVVHYEGGAPEFVARIPDDWSEQQVIDLILRPMRASAPYPAWEIAARVYSSPTLFRWWD